MNHNFQSGLLVDQINKNPVEFMAYLRTLKTSYIIYLLPFLHREELPRNLIFLEFINRRPIFTHPPFPQTITNEILFETSVAEGTHPHLKLPTYITENGGIEVPRDQAKSVLTLDV
jgi:hypothetical protein